MTAAHMEGWSRNVLVGLATCVTGASTIGTASFRDPFLAVSAVLGLVALGLVAVGLIAGAPVWVVAQAPTSWRSGS